jgi:hypothetical protein
MQCLISLGDRGYEIGAFVVQGPAYILGFAPVTVDRISHGDPNIFIISFACDVFGVVLTAKKERFGISRNKGS